MSKKRFRFGMDYFGKFTPWIIVDTKNIDGVVAPAYMVIRDTHCEWKVSDLWNLYMAPKGVADK
jgi:hypothetical protein